MKYFFLFLFIVFAQVGSAEPNIHADSSDSRAINYTNRSSIKETIPEDDSERNFKYVISQKEFLLSTIIMFLLILSLIIEAILITKGKIPPEQAVKTIIITIIVFGGFFLVTSGYDDQHVAPLFGLLGTISGYLFARNDNKSSNPSPSKSDTEN
jgi:hypothetical protein